MSYSRRAQERQILQNMSSEQPIEVELNAADKTRIRETNTCKKMEITKKRYYKKIAEIIDFVK